MDRPPLVDGEKDCCRKKGGEAFTAAELGKATHLAALEREVRRAVKHVVVAAGTYVLERGGKKGVESFDFEREEKGSSCVFKRKRRRSPLPSFPTISQRERDTPLTSHAITSFPPPPPPLPYLGSG